jgi:hypothetical protein
MADHNHDQAQHAVPAPAAAENISDGSLPALKAGETGVENDGPTVASDAPCVEAHDTTRYASIIDLVNATADKPSKAELAKASAADLRSKAHQELRKMEAAELARTFSDGWMITGEGSQAALAQRHLPGRLNSGWLTKSSKGWNPFVRTARRFFALVIMDLAELCEKSRPGSGACDGIVLFHADSENTMAETARKPILLDVSYGVTRHASLDIPSSSYYAFSVKEESGAGKIMLGAQTPRVADAWVWMIEQAMTSKVAGGAGATGDATLDIASPKQAPAPQPSRAPPTNMTRDRFYDSAPHPGRWGESNTQKSAAHDGSLGNAQRRASAVPQYDLSAILDLHSRSDSGSVGGKGGGQVDDARAWGDGSARGFSGATGGAGSGGRVPKIASEEALRSCAATKDASSSRCSVVPAFNERAGRAGGAHASWRHSAPH